MYDNKLCTCIYSAGGLCQGLAFPVNLGRFGNSMALFLGVEPADLFLYVFLPPLLFDASVRIYYFIFKKVSLSLPLLTGCQGESGLTIHYGMQGTCASSTLMQSESHRSVSAHATRKHALCMNAFVIVWGCMGSKAVQAHQSRHSMCDCR